MPYSDSSNVTWTEEKIKEIEPNLVLDIGAGAGKYGKLVKNIFPSCIAEAIEVWEPYIDEFSLKEVYNTIYQQDARKFDFLGKRYDIIFLGDILEHMTEKEAIDLWLNCLSSSSYVIMSIPTVHYPQGHEHGNPYEEHVVDNWTHDLVIEKFTGISQSINFEITSSYLAKGK